MLDINVNNQTSYKIDDIVSDMTEYSLKKLGLDNVSLSVNLVSNEEILEINKEYRKKNSVTDVITFAYEDDNNFNQLLPVRELGDIFIAVDKVYENSLEIGHSMQRELSFVVAHGILHTLGYNHENESEAKEMFDLQEEIIIEIIGKGSELDAIFSR